MIAEALSITNEELIISRETSIKELKNQLIKKYPVLEKLEYQIALNQKITLKETPINTDCEIALMPPFAGG